MRVESPPLRTAGPMSTKAAWALSLLLPDTVKNAWQICTGGGKVLVRFKRLQKKSTCIINTEPNSYDDIHGTDDVHGEAPEMHVTTQVNLVGKTLLNWVQFLICHRDLLTKVTATQRSTMTEPRKLARRSRVVRKTQAKAIPKFLTSSRTITSSVSQLLYSWCRHRHCNRHIV